MTQNWGEWSKPWSKEQCELRYVEGEKITIDQLSLLSDRPTPTLRRWAKADSWRIHRTAFHADVARQTREKTVEKLSDELSDVLSVTSSEHLESYRVCRQLAMMRGRFLMKQIEPAFRAGSLSENPDADPLAAEALAAIQLDAIQKLNPAELNLVSLIVDRCVRGERMVAGLEYESVNAAIAACEKAGLEVKVPPDAVLAQFGSSQGEKSSSH